MVIYDDKDKCCDDPEAKAYACPMCHAGFEDKRSLATHMAEHADAEVRYDDEI